MCAAYTSFGLAPATRAGGVLADGGYQVHRDFLDFIVDGRPLLFRLSDLDAVSPLAADVPPAIFIDHVRRLLLEAEAPLADGRYVIYGCPECEALACGAVTAVIERAEDGSGAYVWRDFAWQTEERADLELNGYRGIGPFRFRAEEYRSALSRLLKPEDLGGSGAAPGPGPLGGTARRRVLLIGARAAVLAQLAAALRIIGIGAETVPADALGVAGGIGIPAEELCGYGAVAFGRAVTDAQRTAVRGEFERAGLTVAYVDGLAPIVPLLVAQVEQALGEGQSSSHRLTGLTVADGEADVQVASTCRVRLTAYRLDRLHRSRTHEVYEGVLEPGSHRIVLDPKSVRGRAFLVARAPGAVLVAAVDDHM
ncbi:oxidoreductase [Streptomyces cavernicola]|uniref:Oxidoreductase n=1 Tax=Streptomyces cavernicola TaxID=3043613 RepID=A0ABT6S847_9ACTN|nr:oxidoreductase [Streptomyces sp. B-S-A6]MDI3404049.1 oxidoreductase [Streptomyces sp. B-S-A6]